MQKIFFVLLFLILFPSPLIFAQNVVDNVGFSDEVSPKITSDTLAKISSKLDNIETKIVALNQTISLLRADLNNNGTEIQEVFDTGTSIVNFGDSVLSLITTAINLKNELTSEIDELDGDISVALTIIHDIHMKTSLEKIQNNLSELKQEIEKDSLFESLEQTHLLVEDIHSKINDKTFGLKETKNEVRNIEFMSEELLEQIIEIKKQNDELLEIILQLKSEINSLDENLLNHEQWSSSSNYLAMISGSIIGLAGAFVGITQLLITRNKTKEESIKRKHVTDQIKRNLVDILDLAKTLEKISPNSEKLFDMRTWKLIQLRVKAISILLTGSMTLLDTKLSHRILGYVNYMDERFDIAEKKHHLSYVFLVKHTESFLDKFFPEHRQERLSLIEQMEEQAKWFEQQQEKENEEMLKYYEEKYGSELYMDVESETEEDNEEESGEKLFMGGDPDDEESTTQDKK